MARPKKTFSPPVPVPSRRPFPWKIAAAVALAAACGFALLRSGSPKGDSEAVTAAVEHLQRNRHQEAIDALAREKSARAAWLRAVALENIARSPENTRRNKGKPDLEPARDQIQAALAREPENTTYRGFELRLQLQERPPKMEAADELISMYEADRTSAALALFAFYAHSAKSVYDRVLKQDQSAKGHSQDALAALNTAIALNADIPEFQRELLTASVAIGLADQVDVLSARLLEMAPEDASILRDRISVLIAMRRYDDAAEAAETYYALENRSAEAALVLSHALTQSSPSEQHAERLERLCADHPQSLTLIVQHALSLAKLGQVKKATAVFESALASRSQPSERAPLLDSMMTVLLETGNGDLAAEKLAAHRAEIGNPILINYFEGRILFLKKDYRGALERLNEVLKTQKDAVGTDRAIARNALRWIQVILRDAEASQKLAQASDAVQQSLSGDAPALAELPEE